MPKLRSDEVRTMLVAEKNDAMSAVRASQLTAERARALEYYVGDVSADIPDIDGRSRAVSTDVSDTVEGLMPILMEIFAGSDEVMKFEPNGPEDVEAAAQETDYVNYVFTQKNPGFLVLYSFIKDALLSKTGIVKVWTEPQVKQTEETFYDQPDDAFAMLAANKELEIVAHSMRDTPFGPLHDVTVRKSKEYKCHRICALPPEEFGISRNSRNLKDASYCFHETRRRQADLIDDGYDEDQIRELPEWTQPGRNIEEISRDTVGENMLGRGDTGANLAMRLIVITEHHIRMDYEGTGTAQLYRVMTGGPQGEILMRGGKPQIMAENHIPMAAMTPVIITHRFFGRSIADLVMDIQRIKTALMRALLDNTYMAVNPRPEVAETMATEQTLDDLLIMRPGQPIRVKQPGGINWQQVPFVGEQILPVMQFMDTTREWRTGVSRQSQGVDPNALQNQVATIANQMQAASDQKVKLIARIFAETGIRDMFQLLHAEIREHGDQAQIVRLRNQWVPVDPTQWKEREDMTVNVGLGTGSKPEELAKLQLLIAAQTQAIQVGMVSRANLYNSARELVRLTGRKDVESYFVDPARPPNPQEPASAPLPPPADPNEKAAQADMVNNQAKMQLEQQKAQSDQQREAAQAQSEIAISNQKFELEKQLKLLDAQIAAQKHQFEMESNAQKLTLQQQKSQQPAKAAVEVRHNSSDITGPMADVVTTLGNHLTNLLNAHTQTITSALAQHAAPKRIRKVGNGEYVTEPVIH